MTRRRWKNALILLFLAPVVGLLSQAAVHAYITQPDGAVVPITNRLQQCLDRSGTGETTAGAVDAVEDARIIPEAYRPVEKPLGSGKYPVVFNALGEGAGYRNSFGYYYVDEDPRDPANLRTVFDCRPNDAQCACPCNPNVMRPGTSQVTINFENEPRFQAGRAIGFWLRTPEKVDGSGNDDDNCGDRTDTSNRIYFTSKSLNDDGDFVHFLVYESQTFENSYYFGFEDLFRGGDNDYEDMLVRASGLVPICTPQPETCNDKDDDCDLKVDENVTRGCSSACGNGLETCEGGSFGLCSAPDPQAEACDGLDNDCDLEIDEGNPGGGALCVPEPNGGYRIVSEEEQETQACTPGRVQCIGGENLCVGTQGKTAEICNCLDDDCDGEIDEGALCGSESGEGGACIACACVSPCQAGEFPCPQGRICDRALAMPEESIIGYCVRGQCASVECTEQEVCDPTNGECVNLCEGVSCNTGFACVRGSCVEDNCYGRGCDVGEVCKNETCVPDLCAGVSCESDAFCREGQCIAACTSSCPRGQTCQDGTCKSAPCGGCGTSRSCVNDECVLDNCGGPCGIGRVCQGTECVDDPCAGVVCPTGATCSAGNCAVDQSETAPKWGLASGGGGSTCAVSKADSTSDLWLLWLAVGLAFLRRKSTKIRVHSSVLPMLTALLLSASCSVDPYCFGNCSESDGGDPADGGVDPGCVPQNEICNGRDDDCDGKADEEWDLQTDLGNCGVCGKVCSTPQAFAVCDEGVCAIERCEVGFHDLNGALVDGCEYRCENSGEELCDEIDNDCDGFVDEDCKADCMASGDEVCNGLDDDCNGAIDDGLSPPGTPPASCSQQQGVCAGRTATCRGAAGWECDFPETYQMIETICDDLDNDCDGTEDEGCLTRGGGDRRLDTEFGSGERNSSQMAVSGNGASHVYATWISWDEPPDLTVDRPKGTSRIFFTRTTNNGSSWSSPFRLDESSGPAFGPDIGVSTGAVNVLWPDFRGGTNYREIFLARSTNSGSSFGGDSRVNVGQNIDSFDVDVATSGNNVYVVYQVFTSSRSRHIFFARSTNNGASWANEFQIDHGTGANFLAATPKVVARASDVHVIWRDNRGGGTDIFYSRSTDSGATFSSTDRRLNTGVSQGSVSAFDPDIAVEGNNVYVVWVDNRTGDSFDIFLNRSTNRGGSWLSTPRDIDQDSLPHESIEPKVVTSLADMAVVAWVDYRFGFPDILSSVSVDAGTSFSQPTRVDTADDPGETGSYDIAMKADGALVGVAWADDRAGLLDVYANFSLDGGQTFQPQDYRMDTSSVGSSDSQRPQVWVANNRVHVIWEDNRAGQLADVYYNKLE